MLNYDPRPFADGPPASPPLQVAKTSPRFLWVIFDEWDQRLTFLDRLPGSRQLRLWGTMPPDFPGRQILLAIDDITGRKGSQ